MIFHKTPLVIPVLKLKLKNITFVLDHTENSAFRRPTSIFPRDTRLIGIIITIGNIPFFRGIEPITPNYNPYKK